MAASSVSTVGREGSADTSSLLRSALEGHYTGWRDRQRWKMEQFIDDALDRGLVNMHDPMVWGKGSVKFLTPEDQPPQWMSEEEALECLYSLAEEALAERGVASYHLDHGFREYARDKSFVFFRLCHNPETSLENWRREMRQRTVEYAADAVKVMLNAASSGAADVWAKLPSGRFANFLVKDDLIPVGLTREEAIQDIYRTVVTVLHEEFELPGVDVAIMGNVMTGTWFKLTYHIPLPPQAALSASPSKPRSCVSGVSGHSASSPLRTSSSPAVKAGAAPSPAPHGRRGGQRVR